MRTIKEKESLTHQDTNEPYELAVYKRLGLSSEKAKNLVAITANIPLDRLQGICEAEREGRCVVLLCKPKDIIYGIDIIRKRVIRYMVTSITVYQEYGRTLKVQVKLEETEGSTDKISFTGRKLSDTDFETALGVRYFLTKTEAIKALERLE